MQRKSGKLGANLGKTTGWIHRADLVDAGVQMLSDVRYEKFDKDGFHILEKGQPRVIAVDHVIICAGQEPNNALAEAIKSSASSPVHIIGGALEAAELDAKRAILQGTQLGLKI